MTGWDTRAQSGLRSPRAISTNINPTHGTGGHHGGAGPFRRNSHADCRTIWRAWQDWHMSPANANNYNDIAYSLGVCHHDIVLEGRSTRTRPRIRGGANGNATVNGNRYSIVAIWGSNDGAWPDSLKRAWRFARDWLRQQDSRMGTGITPHRDMASTTCPVNGTAWMRAGAPLPSITTPPPPPPPPEDTMSEAVVRAGLKSAIEDAAKRETAYGRQLGTALLNALRNAGLDTAVANEVYKRFTHQVKDTHWAAVNDILPAGHTVAPWGALRAAWAHGNRNGAMLTEALSELAALRETVGEILAHDSSNPLTKADLEDAIERGMQRVQVQVSVVENDLDEDDEQPPDE